jgi:UPF0716 protein FxsA
VVALVLVLVFIVFPLVELTVLVRVAGEVGVLETFALLVLVGVVGWWLCKQQGLGVLRRVQDAAARGEVPNRELADGGLIALGGLLLLLPGFISDALALVLLLPPTRAVVRGLLGRSIGRRAKVVRAGAMGRTFVDVEVVDVQERGRVPRPPQSGSPSGPSSGPPELGRG